PEVGAPAFGGCFVIEGEARATVVATGGDTRLAGIAAATRAQEPAVTPLHRELARVSRMIAVLAVSIGTSFFGLALLAGTEPTDGFLFAIGVTVAVVPEGLLPTV